MIELAMSLCQGNPGALTLCCQMIKADPDRAQLILNNCLALNLKGSDLYMVWDDDHNRDLEATMADLEIR